MGEEKRTTFLPSQVVFKLKCTFGVCRRVDTDHDVLVKSALKVAPEPVEDTVHLYGEGPGSEPGVVHRSVLWRRRVVKREEGLGRGQFATVLQDMKRRVFYTGYWLGTLSKRQLGVRKTRPPVDATMQHLSLLL